MIGKKCKKKSFFDNLNWSSPSEIDENLLIIDLQKLANNDPTTIQDFENALSNVGCFYIKNYEFTGITHNLLEALFKTNHDFLNEPEQKKLKMLPKPKTIDGYIILRISSSESPVVSVSGSYLIL